MSLTKAGTIVRIDSRKGATMNLNLSDWDWLNAALGVLFLYRGIRDLYNGTGTGWSSEDEKKHFRKFYGIASILCGFGFGACIGRGQNSATFKDSFADPRSLVSAVGSNDFVLGVVLANIVVQRIKCYAVMNISGCNMYT